MTTNTQIAKELQQGGFKATPISEGVIVSLDRYLWIDEVQVASYQFEWGQELPLTFKRIDRNHILIGTNQ